jgi:hypothetical protein
MTMALILTLVLSETAACTTSVSAPLGEFIDSA